MIILETHIVRYEHDGEHGHIDRGSWSRRQLSVYSKSKCMYRFQFDDSILWEWNARSRPLSFEQAREVDLLWSNVHLYV